MWSYPRNRTLPPTSPARACLLNLVSEAWLSPQPRGLHLHSQAPAAAVRGPTHTSVPQPFWAPGSLALGQVCCSAPSPSPTSLCLRALLAFETVLKCLYGPAPPFPVHLPGAWALADRVFSSFLEASLLPGRSFWTTGMRSSLSLFSGASKARDCWREGWTNK